MNQNPINEEKSAPSLNGMTILILNILLIIVTIAGFVLGASSEKMDAGTIVLMVVCGLYAFLIGPIIFAGLKVLKPNEAMVLTLFGNYYGTLKGPGFFFVNPFVASVCPSIVQLTSGSIPVPISETTAGSSARKAQGASSKQVSKKISLKAMTLNNEKQKVNDALGNPVIISIVVIWKVVNAAKAVFNVDNYFEFLSIQCDSAARNIVRLYPYDASEEEGEKSLRGNSQEIAESLKKEVQGKVDMAGLEILEARITHLSYASEIAAAMLQRQQASAIIAARQMIVEGAVGMVEMALAKLSDRNIVNLDEERKAAMVSNLLVVLCSNKDPQPIVNSGSIY
ncbi:MAG: SPFH domain / Band 7 family protein [Spirochaetes bacterium ADurb.Bin110]|nr:MAG: SPFH domain / Band 7 family protein [Spirochaetes bacterium ADurb.Bin110]